MKCVESKLFVICDENNVYKTSQNQFSMIELGTYIKKKDDVNV